MVQLHHLPGLLKSKKKFVLQSTLTKPDQAAAALMTHFVCMLGARSEKYLLSEGGGWKKTVHISKWGQAKFYLPLARLSCRKAFRLDLKLF